MDLINRIRAIAWYQVVIRKAGVTTAYELSKKFDGLRAAKNKHDNRDTKSFTPYANGSRVPSKITLDMVEEYLPGTKLAFNLGLPSESGDAPLWLAIGGTQQACEAVLDWFDKDYFEQQLISGAPMHHLAHWLTNRWLDEEHVFDNISEANADPKAHYIALLYRENRLKINMDQLTVLVALWRLSMIKNSGYPYLHYFMSGFMQKAIPDLLRPFGIADIFPEYCNLYTENHLKNLRLMEAGRRGDTDRS